MTMRPCYRVACDAPGCTASEWSPHERSSPARLQFAALGWTVIEYRESASGAARLAYACPAHRDWKPQDDGRRLVSMKEKQVARLRRAAMLWMLHEGGATYGDLAGPTGLSAVRVSEVVKLYENVVTRRQRSDRDWIEPWARRLRAAGAIP